MDRRRLAIVLAVAGAAATIAGAEILLEVRDWLEHGALAALRRFFAAHSQGGREQLEAYRWPGLMLVVAGPAALVGSYLLWPRGVEAVEGTAGRAPATAATRRSRRRRRRRG